MAAAVWVVRDSDRVRTGPKGTRAYRARVYYRGRYVASRTFARKRDAQEWERKQVETWKTGAWADPKAGDGRFESGARFGSRLNPLRRRRLNGMSAGRSRDRLRVRSAADLWCPFGRRRFNTGQPSFRASSPRQLHVTPLGVLRRVFDRAVRDGAIHRNPAAGVRLPKVQGNDPRLLTHVELWFLAGDLGNPRDRLLVLVAGYCGLRWGEVAALRWADVDLVKRMLQVARSYSEEAPSVEMSPVKDHQVRTIPSVVSEELATFRADRKQSELVFLSGNRTPLRNRNFRRDVFDDAVVRLGFDITPYNLRDTAASLAIQAGVSVVAVARLLGRESAATTLNHYAGLFPSDLDDVATRLITPLVKFVTTMMRRMMRCGPMSGGIR